jgi:signal transduction histidine kinase
MNRPHRTDDPLRRRIIRSHEANARHAEYRDIVTAGQAADRLGAIRPFAGDGLLAAAVAVAAGIAATGATPDEPLRTLLVLFAVAACLTLAFRRLYPVTVLATSVFVTGFFAWVYGGYWPFAALVAFYSVAAHSPRRRAIVAGAIGLLALVVPIVAAVEHWRPITWSNTALVAGRLAPLVAAWILGDNVRTRREYLQAIEDRATQLEREQLANARRAAAEEQARIAREVHDIVAHNLSVIIVQATAADAVFASDPADARRAVRTIGGTARQALDELRRVLGVVRIGDERSPSFPPQPTLARLEHLVERVRTAGLAVELDVSGQPESLSPALELSAYRIVQEALTNTLRHADADHALVSLRFEPEAVEVDVVDDGAPSVGGNGAGGQGLIGMRERAAAFGGYVETGPDPAGGFRVHARLPLAGTRE